MDTKKLDNKDKEKDLVSEKHNCFKYLFDYSPDFQVVLDEEGKITAVNQAFKKITGEKKRELIGTFIYEIMPVFRRITKKIRSQRIKKKRVWNIEVKLDRPGRLPIFCDLFFLVFVNKEGEKIIHLSGRDISESRRTYLDLTKTGQDLEKEAKKSAQALKNSRSAEEKLEKEAKKSAQALKNSRSRVNRLKKLSIIGQSVVDVAHEIKNPLTTINLISQYLQSMSVDYYQTEQLQAMQRNLNRINKIVFSLLHLFEPSIFNFIDCNINGILERLIFNLGVSLPENIKIIERYGSNIPLGRFDSASLEQVFLNIIFNAMQAMPEGGELYITTSFDPVQNGIMINFEDIGVGIPEENLKKILKPYFTTFEGGTGLGLSICRNVLKKHKGTLSIDSKLGEGTVVDIYLPIKKEKEKNRNRVENND